MGHLNYCLQNLQEKLMHTTQTVNMFGIIILLIKWYKVVNGIYYKCDLSLGLTLIGRITHAS